MIWVVVILLGVIVLQLWSVIILLQQKPTPTDPLNDPRWSAIDDAFRLAKSIDHHLAEIDRRIFEMSTKLPR